MRIYIGTDATGCSLHLGHATNYMILEQFRQLGHEVIFLIGDFTSRIGDPTDKTAVRKKLTREDVIENTKTWLDQIKPIINLNDQNNPVTIMYNHTWFSKMDLGASIDLSRNFTVRQLLERDMFEKRMRQNAPIYLHEFLYPMMQGWDSVEMDVDIEMCGNDQKFNALIGRDLQRKYRNKEKYIFITTLLENPVTGEKMMSKSMGTGVFLDFSAEEMFKGIMRQADENIYQLFVDCTRIPMEEIDDIKMKLQHNVCDPHEIKKKLAMEIVSIYHGTKTARALFEKDCW